MIVLTISQGNGSQAHEHKLDAGTSDEPIVYSIQGQEDGLFQVEVGNEGSPHALIRMATLSL